MLERLETIEERFRFLEIELTKPEILKNRKVSRDLSREYKQYKEIVEIYLEYKKVLDNINEAQTLLNDSEYADMAKEELEVSLNLKNKIESDLEVLLLPKDKNDDRDVIIEIRGAAGGDEANIFAGDLYRMYTKYAEENGFKCELLDSTNGTNGGFSGISFMIKGENAYANLKYESGAHRVQRVPLTETQGRIHTSTATVLVMPEAEDFDVEVNEADIRVDVCRSSGAGGQGVNTTDSAVRMTHEPTGIVVYCQTERSQIKNRERALKILKTRIYEKHLNDKLEAEGNIRKSIVGTGDRSEKIRTYNYPQNRITDHRIGYTSMNLDKFMEGKISDLITELINEDQKRQIEGK